MQAIPFLSLIAALLAPASSVQTARSPAFEQVVSLCVKHRADRNDVLTAADADGWKRPSLDGSEAAYSVPIPDLDPDRPVAIRIKQVGGVNLVLVLREDLGATPVGLVFARHCSVSAPGSDFEALRQDSQSYFGRPALNRDGQLEMWSFHSSGEARRFVRLGKDAYYKAVARRTLSQLTVDVDSGVPRATYSEAFLAGPISSEVPAR